MLALKGIIVSRDEGRGWSAQKLKYGRCFLKADECGDVKKERGEKKGVYAGHHSRPEDGTARHCRWRPIPRPIDCPEWDVFASLQLWIPRVFISTPSPLFDLPFLSVPTPDDYHKRHPETIRW